MKRWFVKVFEGVTVDGSLKEAASFANKHGLKPGEVMFAAGTSAFIKMPQAGVMYYSDHELE